MSVAAAEPTFRDPAGSLVVERDRAVRTIRPEFREAVFEFLNSNFCHRAVDRGDMIVSVVEDDADGLRLIHPRVRIPTYPWEWAASQWLSAAELTLRLCDEAGFDERLAESNSARHGTGPFQGPTGLASTAAALKRSRGKRSSA